MRKLAVAEEKQVPKGGLLEGHPASFGRGRAAGRDASRAAGRDARQRKKEKRKKERKHTRGGIRHLVWQTVFFVGVMRPAQFWRQLASSTARQLDSAPASLLLLWQ
jgi:hypothetical protein